MKMKMRMDTIVATLFRVRARDKEEMGEGNFSVVAGRNPFVVTFEPSFSFKGHARVHPLRYEKAYCLIIIIFLSQVPSRHGFRGGEEWGR